jgi:hypothetical protein
MASTVRTFQGRARRTASGGATIPFPFDPAEAWGPRDRYHVTGTIGGIRVRTTLVYRAGSWHIDLGPKSCSAAPLTDGETVEVEVWPEGPQSEQLAPDIAGALAARPRAQSAFDGLATFYRKGWLRWIDGTKRRPEVRAERIAEMVRLLEAGHKERP